MKVDLLVGAEFGGQLHSASKVLAGGLHHGDLLACVAGMDFGNPAGVTGGQKYCGYG
jgi:hypothetical protein